VLPPGHRGRSLGAGWELELALDDIQLVEHPSLPASYQPQKLDIASPTGPLRVLLCKHAAAGYYGIAKVARNLPQTVSVDVARFRGLHLPLEGFPESREELAKYSLVAMVDVDPIIITAKQLMMLADYVASGGGLLLAGGPSSFGDAASFPPLLETILPVEQEDEGKLKEVNNPVAVTGDHPVTTGFPDSFGYLSKAHQLLVKPGATALMRCRPVTPEGWNYYTAGTRDNATVRLSSDAHTGQRSAMLEVKSYYRDPKTGKDAWLSVALIQGNSTGAIPQGAYVIKPDTEYLLSFWIKGDVPEVTPSALGWPSADSPKSARQRFPLSAGPVKLDPNRWQRYEGTFRTATDTKRLVIMWDLKSAAGGVQPGQGFMVDDVELVEVGTEGEGNLLTNPGAESSGEVPVLVAGNYHDGRVLVLNVFPDVHPQAMPHKGHLVLTDFYDDLLRQALRWVARREPAAGFSDFAPPPSELHPGEALDLEFETFGQAQSVRVRLEDSKEEFILGPKPLTPGPMRWDGIAMPESPFSQVHYEVNVELLDAQDEVLVRRDFPLVVSKPTKLEVTAGYKQPQVTEAGKSFRYVVSGGAELVGKQATMEIWDRGSAVLSLPAQTLPANEDGQARAELEFPVPNLEEGDYWLRATVEVNAEEIAAELPIFVASPMPREELLPIMGVTMKWGGAHMMDDEGIVERAHEMYDHGFTTISTVGFAGDREALGLGLTLFTDYSSYSDLQPRERPEAKVPCIFAPEYYAHAQKYMAGKLAAHMSLPRYVSSKIKDEPKTTPFTIDYCEYCRQAYRQLHGEEMPEWMPQLPDALQDFAQHYKSNEPYPSGDAGAVARRKWAEFMSLAVEKAFAATYRAKQEAGAQFDLILTYAPEVPTWVAGNRLAFGDALNWSRHCDMLDFDQYAYFYPSSQKLRMGNPHYTMGYFRTAAAYLDKPWGFYVEVDDRNWPFQKNPYNASSELGYMALAQGAGYLNTFITRPFGTGSGAREERWDDWGREMSKVRSLGALIVNTRRQLAPIAWIHPTTTQYMLESGNVRKWYTYEYIRAAFGEADVVDERILADQGLEPYKCLVLMGAPWVNGKVAEMLTDLVRSGGLLICDSLPEADENNQPIAWPAEFSQGEESAWDADMPVQRCRYGTGELVRLKFDTEELCRAMAEEEQLEKSEVFRNAVRELIDGHGIRPQARSSNPRFEAGVRHAEGSSLLFVVSHAEQAEQTTVTLSNLPHAVGFACDMFTREPIEYQQDGDSLSFACSLDSRCARIIGLYPTKPEKLDLELAKDNLTRGDELKYRLRLFSDRVPIAQGSHLVKVTVSDPQGQTRPLYSGPVLCTGGSKIVSTALAINAPLGTWTITAEDWLGNKSAPLSFEVR